MPTLQVSFNSKKTKKNKNIFVSFNNGHGVHATPLYENKAAQANILCPQPHTAVAAQARQHGEHRPAAPPPTFPWTSPVMVEDMVCPYLDYEREMIIDNERETERQRNVNRTLQMIEDALNYSNR